MLVNINLFRLTLHCSIVVIFAVVMPVMAVLYANQTPSGLLPAIPALGHAKIFSEMLIRWVLLSSILIPVYFFNAYYLLPKFLTNRRYVVYFLSIIVCFSLVVSVSKIVEYLLIKELMLSESLPYPPLVFPMTLLLGIGTSLEMVLQWENQKRKQESIEKEKISAELSFLKSQINPHFLFNTLNNIYSLAERNSNKTGQSILLLSNLMRYILYDTSDGKILLSNEIRHLEEYITLQRMRIADVTNVSIDFINEIRSDKVLIEPLIFIPFVENAFKHGISYANPSFIYIKLSIENDFLIFKVSNSKKNSNGRPLNQAKDQGVGIINTQRRLALLYPERHELKIRDEADSYFVDLTISLKSEKESVQRK
jgi:sensor histidine kinase YesM